MTIALERLGYLETNLGIFGSAMEDCLPAMVCMDLSSMPSRTHLEPLALVFGTWLLRVASDSLWYGLECASSLVFVL